MVECHACRKKGLKLKDCIPAFVDGSSVLYCRKCADEKLGIPDDIKQVELKYSGD